MKLAKSLLLASAAGLVAAGLGHATELPVKAKPIQYLKICSLYGAGFYYMPGTDLCIKLAGWVRAETVWGGNGNMVWGPFNGNVNARTTSNLTMRARGYVTADVRDATEYGTARGYLAVGVNTSDTGLQVPNLTMNANRAFVQWAGMTAGLSESFYDFYNVPAVQYRGGYLPASSTGDAGWFVWAYTAQLSNDVSATVSAESRRTSQIVNSNPGMVGTFGGGSIVPGSYPGLIPGGGALLPGGGAYGGFQVPDVVFNLRTDQDWGAAQIMGAVHEDNAAYYGTTQGTGHPADTWGWAAGAGLKLNTPFGGVGDYFQTQLNYSQGATRYLLHTTNSNWGKVYGADEAYGVVSDCVYGGTPAAGTATSCQLTTAWGFNASYEHFWTPQVHSSLYGAYYAVRYNANANAQLCTAAGDGIGGLGAAAIAAPGCNNDWWTWGLGSRTQWDVTKTFYVGVDMLYQELRGATTSDGLSHGYAFGGATMVQASATNFMINVRAHRDFLP